VVDFHTDGHALRRAPRGHVAVARVDVRGAAAPAGGPRHEEVVEVARAGDVLQEVRDAFEFVVEGQVPEVRDVVGDLVRDLVPVEAVALRVREAEGLEVLVPPAQEPPVCKSTTGWVIPAKLQTSLARSNRSRFG
jgi:hypothetical protein